ncbi:trans-1,2-dihydrobenzene-1,2-diol dehydrogenase-like [Pseudophryne corroboree]|uniref:trans-1,2-dihydrobenzene-1,2-diol dehydrogenase-like n=1 Tax=Pseudophryne corroboree TaxID=495146 RepID=UPI0030818A81
MKQRLKVSLSLPVSGFIQKSILSLIMATKWGICSAGKISNDFVAALETLPAQDHQVVAVAARDVSRAKEFAQTFNIPKVYDSYEELARDPDIDVVYVGAIHTVHRDVALMFMKNGKNVLCEKPMAMNLSEVKELTAAARKYNVFLMEAFWSRFFPVYEQIRSLLNQKVLGEVKVVRAEFGANLLGVPRAVEKELGGGAILDIGCYCIQFALMAFNGEKPESVTARGFLNETGADETVTVILQYPGKRQAILTCTMVTELPNQAAICGTKGMIQIPSYVWSPTSIIVNGKETKYSLPPTTRHLNFNNSTGLSYEAEHVRQCLLKGVKESPVMSLADSELLAGIMEEAQVQLGISKKSE